jgi:hypothetical protein
MAVNRFRTNRPGATSGRFSNRTDPRDEDRRRHLIDIITVPLGAVRSHHLSIRGISNRAKRPAYSPSPSDDEKSRRLQEMGKLPPGLPKQDGMSCDDMMHDI